MESVKKATLDDLRAAIGTEIGVSSWRTVTQQMIDLFADATDDHQFIHVDPVRAAETPYGGTIAHGFLSLSLLSTFAFEAIPPLEEANLGINHGFDAVRFSTPVRCGARVRGRFTLASLNVRPSGWIQIAYDVTVDIENSRKPALTARWLTLAVLDQSGGNAA